MSVTLGAESAPPAPIPISHTRASPVFRVPRFAKSIRTCTEPRQDKSQFSACKRSCRTRKRISHSREERRCCPDVSDLRWNRRLPYLSWFRISGHRAERREAALGLVPHVLECPRAPEHRAMSDLPWTRRNDRLAPPVPSQIGPIRCRPGSLMPVPSRIRVAHNAPGYRLRHGGYGIRAPGA